MFYIIMITIFALLDQLSKYLITKQIYGIKTYPIVEGIFHFSYRENNGAAFNFMSNRQPLLIVITTFAMIFMSFLFLRNLDQHLPVLNIAFCLVLGGAIGNYIDRVRLGYVVDFIDIRAINFAVFNLADIFVITGTLLLSYLMIFKGIEL